MLWHQIKSAQQAVKDFNVIDKEDLLLKAEAKFADLIHLDLEEAVLRKDFSALKEFSLFSLYSANEHSSLVFLFENCCTA